MARSKGKFSSVVLLTFAEFAWLGIFGLLFINTDTRKTLESTLADKNLLEADKKQILEQLGATKLELKVLAVEKKDSDAKRSVIEDQITKQYACFVTPPGYSSEIQKWKG